MQSTGNSEQIKASIAKRFVLPIRFYCRASYAMPVCLAVAFSPNKRPSFESCLWWWCNVGFVSSNTHTPWVLQQKPGLVYNVIRPILRGDKSAYNISLVRIGCVLDIETF